MHSFRGPTPIEALESAGQSVWLDAFDPDMLASGELQRWLQAGIRGLTSNPALLAKKLTHSEIYDSYIKQASQFNPKITAEEIYENIAIQALREVADKFNDIYQKSNYREGYVSFEISPAFARNTDKTISEAKRLWESFDRPNLMIKIPGTEEGVKACEELIFSGINVNVTLLFSVDRYEKIALAFVKGVERRIAARLPVHQVQSVASFFVSRIDAAIKKVLGMECFGEVAIANAKSAYQSYLIIFQNKEWEKCRAFGAETQRLLWASTSVKSKELADVYYLEELIGADTVTTVPPETLRAFEDHGSVRVSLNDDLRKAKHCLEDRLPAHGIDFKKITVQLEKDAIELFKTPFDEMISAIEAKRARFARRSA